MKKILSMLLATLFVFSAMVAFSAVPAFGDDDEDDDDDDDGQAFVVSPTGGDDTANIQAAFDGAVAAGPGSTVILTGGTFRTGIIEVSGFEGTFRGAGKHATTITSLPSLACGDEALRESFPSLFKFRGGDVRISDLSFVITEFEPCDTWIIPDQGLPRNDLGAIVMITSRPIDASFDCLDPAPDFASSSVHRVGFMGSEGTIPSDVFSHNVDNAILISGEIKGDSKGDINCIRLATPLVGTHSVSDSSFDNMLVGVDVLGVRDSQVTVGGHRSAGNDFDIVNLGILLDDASNSEFEISHNDLRNMVNWGVLAHQGVTALFLQGQPLHVPSPSRYLISHNSIHGIVFADGIGVNDWSGAFGAKTLLAVVAFNHIILDDTIFGGIFGAFTQDVVVLGNRISGTGFAGIYAGVIGDTVSGWKILFNDLTGMTPVLSPAWPPVPSRILLGPGSSGFLVIGRNAVTDTLDFGTGNTIRELPLRT